jgi:cell division protein FtsQ
MLGKILKIIAYALTISAIFLLLGFAVDSNNKTICNNFNISINYDFDNYFVEENDVLDAVYANIGQIEGMQMSEIDLPQIESIVNDMIFVDNAHAYRTIDGQINVIVNPRKAIARIRNSYNQSYYIDNKGKLMPVSRKYTARVPVVYGNIKASYSALIDFENSEYPESPYKKLNEIYKISKYLNANSFWNAFIDQIYINSKGEFELITKSNIHTIDFGSIESMESKFNKLKFFYVNGLTRVGWRQYNRINIKYNNQIVCSK